MADRNRPASARQAARQQPGRGRDAASPMAIPKAGWKDIFWRVKGQIAADHVALVSAGVAFYGLLAVFPAITALMAITGLIYAPAELVSALEGITRVVPSQVSEILLGQARELAQGETAGLTLGAMLGFGLALWSASAGVGSLIEGINLAYDEKETRSFVRLKLTTIGLTLAMILGVIAALALVVALPVALSFLTFSPTMELLVRLLSYVPLAAIVIGGLAVLYRVGPDRAPATLGWLSPGAVAATILWLVASIGFTIYVSNFASYNETFGSLGGAVVLLMWMWISAFVILLGAELNSEIEAQTARDTTTGPREPMGHRNAVKADELGDVA